MKIIHCADVHLGSPLNHISDRQKIENRKQEVRTTFKNVVEYAKDVGASVIMLSGDVFDSNRPFKKDKEFFYSVVKNNPDIDFLYLRGNHDREEGFEEEYQNLKTFSNEWSFYEYGQVKIYGLEMTNDNYVSMYNTFSASISDFNIVMLHGQTSDTTQKDLININKLKGKNIDYLALGHVHSYSEVKLDDRGVYVYSGCPEGRGFDETGKKGIVLLTLENGECKSEFVPMAIRETFLIKVDCTGLKDAFEIYSRIKEIAKTPKKDMLRVELFGEVDFDTEGLEEEISSLLHDYSYLNSIKDRTVRRFDVSGIEDDLSIKGEFIKKVLSSELDDESKKRVISLGLKALSGREL